MFLVDSRLSLVDRISTDFLSQVLCGCLFLALVLWDGEPGLELIPHTSQGGFLQLRHPSIISRASFGSWVSPFHVSVFPTCLILASSVNHWL